MAALFLFVLPFISAEVIETNDPRLVQKRQSLGNLEVGLEMLTAQIHQSEQVVQQWNDFSHLNKQALELQATHGLEGSDLFFWLRRRQETSTLVSKTKKSLPSLRGGSVIFNSRAQQYLKDLYSLSPERQGCETNPNDCLRAFTKDQANSVLRLQYVFKTSALDSAVDPDNPSSSSSSSSSSSAAAAPAQQQLQEQQQQPPFLLTVQDCYQLGLTAMEKKLYNISTEWFNLVLERKTRGESCGSITSFHIYSSLALSHSYNNEIHASDEYYQLALRTNHNSTANGQKEVNGFMSSYQKSLTADTYIDPKDLTWQKIVNMYNELCYLSDANPNMDVVSTTPQRKWLWEGPNRKITSPLWELFEEDDLDICIPLNPKISAWDSQRIAVEVVSTVPPLLMLHNFLTDWECERLKNVSLKYEHKWIRALIADLKTGEWIPSDYRSSHTTFLFHYMDPVILELEKRITRITGLDYEGSDALTLNFYPPGGHYDPHHDYNIKVEGGEFGGRTATLLYYLNDVQAGGATAFTDAVPPFAVRPRKGAAAFWYNLAGPVGSSPQVPFETLVEQNKLHSKSKRWYNQPQFDIMNGITETRHAACPVLAGEKWVGNKWIREYPHNSHRYSVYYKS